MNAEVLEGFPLELSLEEALGKLRIGKERADKLGASEVFRTAMSLVRPKALFGHAYVSRHRPDRVQVEDVGFTSRILSKNLEEVERVFPYIITIGEALEKEAHSSEGIAKGLLLETLGDLALGSSLEYVENHLSGRFGLGTLSNMGPGQLDWPIAEQRQLFAILGEVTGKIGVTLTDSLLMVPRKSISGIIFPTDVTFTSCQLCERKNCPSRKAPYDTDLARKYIQDGATDHSRSG